MLLLRARRCSAAFLVLTSKPPVSTTPELTLASRMLALFFPHMGRKDPQLGNPCAEVQSRAQLFPYHLAEHVCRDLRVSPFRYYIDLLSAVLREEQSYDQIPNFTVRGAVGRNLIG